MELNVTFDPELFDAQNLLRADYDGLVKSSLRESFPEVKGRSEKRMLYSLVSSGASYKLQKMLVANSALIGTTQKVWVPASDDVDMLMKGNVDRSQPESERLLNDRQIAWIDQLIDEDRLAKRFNAAFFTAGDSREPELAGIRGATVGSFYVLLITLLLSFPVGVAAALYLEEFAQKNRWTDLIEVNINNLAAVPSIVYGLLGLAVFLNFFGLPRSSPLVGGLVMTMMTLPTIIIAGRIALQSVPPSIREAALGVGASKMQTVFHHVLPLAMPGMLTGTIIGMARALGESAPLLMIGMVAFIVDVPGGVTDPATALPVQIYLWADSPERAFMERTSAAIMVLLAFLILMNGTAVFLRHRFERRW
jgi:phosphate transport system permease protein